MKLPQTILNIVNRVDAEGGQAFVVGGCVRDFLIGREPKDFDVVIVGMTMAGLERTFPNEKWVGKDFPVMLVEGYEVALARKERKVGGGHTGFACETEGVTLEDDLRRRDLTVNAIAFNPLDRTFIDPFNGREDIEDRVLMPMSEAFKEDPLRVFRAARFICQLQMAPSAKLRQMCAQMGNELMFLPAERVFAEMMKALRTDRPSRFFTFLNSLGVLSTWFPELAALVGREQPPKYHPEGDTFVHTMLVLDRARELGADDVVMWSALVHDLGKAVTDSEAPAFHHYNHEALGVPLVEKMGERLRVPTDFLRVGKKVAKWHLNVHRFETMRAAKRVDLITRLGDDFEAVTLASQADAQGRGPDFINKPYPQREAVRQAHGLYWTVRGTSDMGSGPQVGEKLRQRRIRVFRQNGMGK